MKTRKLFALLLLLIALPLLVCLTSPAKATPHYRITDLGVPPGCQVSYATCLNDWGQVAGNVMRPGSFGSRSEGPVAFLWSRGRMHLLPTLPSPYGSGNDIYNAVASGINNRGEVVGTLTFPIDGTYIGTALQAVVWDHGRLRQIPKLPWPAGSRLRGMMNQNTAIAINDAGQVVGTADEGFIGGEEMPYIYRYQKGTVVNLGPGFATGLNRQGQVSGYVLMDAHGHPSSEGIVAMGSVPPITYAQAILCWPGRTRLTLGQGYALNLQSGGNVIGVNEAVVNIEEPPTSRAGITDALAVSTITYRKIFAHNHKITNIVGSRTTSAIRFAQVVLWRTGRGRSRAIPLPLHWLPQAINARGQIVGGHWLWQHGRSYNLNRLIGPSLGWNIVTAAAINGRGQIAGWGYRRGKPRAFLLTPER